MCTFNGGSYLSLQLESIGQQELAVAELIICDDGSTDGTIEILLDFARRASFPVHIVVNPTTLGTTKNFEKAIALCTGDLIALSDQDDLWFSTKTAALVAELDKNPSAGGIFSDALIIDGNSRHTGSSLWKEYGFSKREQKQVIAGDVASVLLRRPIVTGATLMFRKDLMEELLPIPIGWVHDEWISWRIALRSHLVFTSRRVMAYRTHASQQIGVPPRLAERLTSVWNALCHGPAPATKTRVRKEYLHGAIELERLTTGSHEDDSDLGDPFRGLRAKIAFCEAVLRSFQLPRFQRVRFALGNIDSYRRFRYLPMYSLIRDIFI